MSFSCTSIGFFFSSQLHFDIASHDDGSALADSVFLSLFLIIHTQKTLLLTRWQKESAARKKNFPKKIRATWRRNSNIASREVHCLITTNMFFAEHIFIHIRIKLPLEKERCKYKEKDKIRGNAYFSFKTKKAPLNLLACFRANVGERKKNNKITNHTMEN